jgi:hypothetical protein
MNFSKMHKLKESEMAIKSEVIEKSEHAGMYSEYIKKTNNYYFQIKENKTRKKGNTALKIIDSVELSALIDKPVTKLTKKDKQILSWTALFIFLRVFKARKEFLKNEPTASHIIPTRKEMLTFLFPIASTPITLPIHNGDDSNMKDFMKNLFFDFDKLIVARENFFDPGTKYILRCYANSIGLNDEKYFPYWLK